MGWLTEKTNRAAGAEHARDLRHGARRVRDEGDGAEGGERDVEAVVGEGQAAGVGLDERDRCGGARRAARGLGAHAEHPDGEVDGDGARPPAGDPFGTRRGAAPDLEHVAARHVAEEVPVALVQALGAPQELAVGGVCAEELAVPVVQPTASASHHLREARTDSP